jgi:hypothetical protein
MCIYYFAILERTNEYLCVYAHVSICTFGPLSLSIKALHRRFIDRIKIPIETLA